MACIFWLLVLNFTWQLVEDFFIWVWFWSSVFFDSLLAMFLGILLTIVLLGILLIILLFLQLCLNIYCQASRGGWSWQILLSWLIRNQPWLSKHLWPFCKGWNEKKTAEWYTKKILRTLKCIASLDMELSDKPIMLTPSPCTLSSGRSAASSKPETATEGMTATEGTAAAEGTATTAANATNKAVWRQRTKKGLGTTCSAYQKAH